MHNIPARGAYILNDLRAGTLRIAHCKIIGKPYIQGSKNNNKNKNKLKL